MAEFKCPTCGTVVETKTTTKKVFCPKCLETRSESVIMLESVNESTPHYVGGGFFELPRRHQQ